MLPFSIAALAAVFLLTESPPEINREELRRELTVLAAALDDAQYEVRQQAVKRLEALVRKPELAPVLAVEIRRILDSPRLSFEVRRELTRLSRLLPPPALPPPEASEAELEKIFKSLDDDSCTVRLEAVQRLEWLLENPKMICPVMQRLKKTLAEEDLNTETRRRLEAFYHRVRRAWLVSDPADWNLPPVSDEEIARLLEAFVSPNKTGNGRRQETISEAAERELLDLLARDDCLPRLKEALSAKLAAMSNIEAAARLQTLLDWTKPELVAEFWQDRRQIGRQHLLVGVPSQPPGAQRPSLFDPVDERVAHCVSGNTLTPGDYPVGEAIPHPKMESIFLHFCYLPTPRLRMRYQYLAAEDEPGQLAAISRRTLTRVLEQRRLLSESELMMLGVLDPVEVSRFAGRYFLLVEDNPLAVSGPLRLGGRPSRFGMICVWLATQGTRDAAAGLLEAIAKERFLPPPTHAPYRLHYLAALALAGRDPWPEVDSWLAAQLERTDLLCVTQREGAELGATAAGLLFQRHGEKPEAFRLLPVANATFDKLHVAAYRYADKTAMETVRGWWREREKKPLP